MAEFFSQIPKKPLTRSTISRYNPSVDNYAEAPLGRLFHFVDLSSRTGTAVSCFIFNDLHTLNFGQTEQISRFQQFPHSLKKCRGCTPVLPISEPSGDPVAAIASQIAGLSSDSWRNRSVNSDRAAETAASYPRRSLSRPLSILTCNKKAISPTLTGNALATNTVYKVIPIKRNDLQENDR